MLELRPDVSIILLVVCLSVYLSTYLFLSLSIGRHILQAIISYSYTVNSKTKPRVHSMISLPDLKLIYPTVETCPTEGIQSSFRISAEETFVRQLEFNIHLDLFAIFCLLIKAYISNTLA